MADSHYLNASEIPLNMIESCTLIDSQTQGPVSCSGCRHKKGNSVVFLTLRNK